MTPEYASPEQVRGEPITTASDVYSLGVVLYELLTGERPPRQPSLGPQARVKRRLRGDLENIVRMALRPEPERRYASVDQMSEDVGRHLEGRPVIARPDTFRYRAGKFVRRNRAAVAAAALLAVGLAGGTVAMAWEARIARLERGRAERRFNELRRLANSMLFEFEDSIEHLPGSAPARRLVVARGLEYLDGLARDAGRDPSLQRELARAYVRVGDVQGGPDGSGLGDSAGALASYRKGLALRETLAAAAPADAQAKRDLAVALARIDTLLADGAPRAARE